MPPVNNPAASARIPAQAIISEMRLGSIPWWLPDDYRKLIGLRLVEFDYFVYGTDFTPLVGNTEQSRPIAIGGDADFCILSAVIVATDTANTTFLPTIPELARLRDGASGRDLSNRAVHVDNWFGTAQEPKYWDVPKVLRRNSSFVVTLQSLEATDRNVRVDFHGFKIFPYSQ